jgi:hypothetical protein
MDAEIEHSRRKITIPISFETLARSRWIGRKLIAHRRIIEGETCNRPAKPVPAPLEQNKPTHR